MVAWSGASWLYLSMPAKHEQCLLAPSGRRGEALPSVLAAFGPLAKTSQFSVDGLEGALPFLTLGVSGPREPWPCSCPEPTSSKLRHPWGVGVEVPGLSSSDPV